MKKNEKKLKLKKMTIVTKVVIRSIASKTKAMPPVMIPTEGLRLLPRMITVRFVWRWMTPVVGLLRWRLNDFVIEASGGFSIIIWRHSTADSEKGLIEISSLEFIKSIPAIIIKRKKSLCIAIYFVHTNSSVTLSAKCQQDILHGRSY